MELALTVLVVVELHQALGVQLLPCYGIDLDLLEEGYDGEQVEHVSLLVAVRTLERLQGQGAVVEGKAAELALLRHGLLAAVQSRPLFARQVHLVLLMLSFPHLGSLKSEGKCNKCKII